MNKPEIIFVEQYYYPEGWGGAQIPRDITISWARHGWGVRVLCGTEQYADAGGEPIEDPRQYGVVICKIPRFLGADVRRARILRQLWFCLAALPRLLFGGRPRAMVTQTNPPLCVALLALVAALRRCPLIIIAQDLYPEVLFAHGMLNRRKLGARLLSALFGWAYRRADAVVSLGSRMTERLVEKGVSSEKICRISNWSTGDTAVARSEDNPLLTEWRLRGTFVLVYSGNFGAAHDCETLLRGFARAHELVAELRLVLIGGGTKIAEARRWADSLGLWDCVTFKPFVPFALLPQTFGIAQLGVVTLMPGFDGLVVPSKLLGNMARAVPTLYVGPEGSDVAVYIRESGGGITVVNGDVEGFARRLAELARDPQRLREMGLAAQRYYARFLARDIGLARYQSLLAAVAGPAQTSA